MKKSILDLGKALNRVEQQQISGGKFICCYSNPSCPPSPVTSCIIIGGECHYFAEEGVAC
ncbi:hypothetical protein [Tenacibaculum sediminilitoris]|uniref:hypothetical protein n=1 Tax=Tenacibaculum sediminilitoris TaxID=1820334 RepID=UPI0038B6257F